MTTPIFLLIICLAFILAVCAIIFARPMGRWLSHHSEQSDSGDLRR